MKLNNIKNTFGFLTRRNLNQGNKYTVPLEETLSFHA